ncbi:MAG: DUF362 domain-containing protein [wastewater metagenome]|nr:DUF362 domain-containing protein [Candidatus Loosdrechtia aerotolerans]
MRLMLYTRRFILYLSGLFIVSHFFLRCNSRIRLPFFTSQNKKITPQEFTNPYRDNEKSLVSIVGGEDIRLMIREAVSLIGGFDKIDIKGKLVLVKPNIVTGDSNPTTTNPEVVGAVVRLLHEKGAQRVIVGDMWDMSGLMTFSTAWNMKKTGIREAAEEAGAEVVCFEDYPWLEVELLNTKYIKNISISEWIHKADRIINLPVIKTHKYATYSISLKNFIGATHWKQRPYFVDRDHWEEVISEINQAYTPHLNIIDGTTSMITGGPRSGMTVKTNIILVSGDRIAADITGLGIIKSFGKCPEIVNKGVWEQRQIKRAVEMGLGAGKGQIALKDKALNGYNNTFHDLVRKIKEYIEVI